MRATWLILPLLISACASESNHEPETPYPPAQVTCEGTPCAIVAGALMAIEMVLSPAPPTAGGDRAYNRHAIFGHCEIRSGKVLAACSQVELIVAGAGEFHRTAWVDGFDFEIPGLKTGAYSLTAFSESHQARAELSGVRPGQYVQIEIRISPAKTVAPHK